MEMHPEAQTFLSEVPPGIDGIEATLALMQSVVSEYKYQPQIVALARSIIDDVPQKSYGAESRAIFEYVRSRVRYTQDVDGMEYVQSPLVTLATQHGDCDDQATLLATLLAAVGRKTRFVAAGFNGGEVEHVWTEVWLKDRWFAADTTEDHDFGWRPPNITVRLIRNN
jgi:transglutaminase-like putative cysteine protease